MTILKWNLISHILNIDIHPSYIFTYSSKHMPFFFFFTLPVSDVYKRARCDETGYLPLPPSQLSCDIMRLSPWRSFGDGPSLDNVKNACLSLSVCRFDFGLESCWEPEQMEDSKTPTREFEKSNSRAGISRVCLIRNSVNFKLQSLHKHQLGGFAFAETHFWKRTII